MPIVLVVPQPVATSNTSGTVGNTIIDTATVLEHAFRRVKVHPAQQTPETVKLARENLYLLLLNMANRGLNLWCVQSDFIGLANGQSVYDLVPGTIDVLNVVYSQPTRATGLDSSTPNSFTTQFDSTTTVRRVGLKFDLINAAESILLEHSADGITWATSAQITKSNFEVGVWYWFNQTQIPTDLYFRISTVNPITVNQFYLATQVNDLPVIQWNRDTWSTINNKYQSGHPSTNYYLERLIEPRLTLWPVPDSDFNHIEVFSQRQIQDIGTLTQSMELPQRWLEAIIWQLALRMAFELPQVTPDIINIVSAMADKTLSEVEKEETDGAPMHLQPNIGVYTR